MSAKLSIILPQFHRRAKPLSVMSTVHIVRIRLNDDISDGQWLVLPSVASPGQWKQASVQLDRFTVAQNLETGSDVNGLLRESNKTTQLFGRPL